MSRAQLTSTVEQNTGGAVAPFVAGKNAIINGGFDIWQRGTSIALAASTGVTYTADRWCTQTGANQAVTISRQATGDTTNLPNIQYALRYQRNSGQTGTGTLSFIQNIETINTIPFVGKQITVSFYARAGANFSATPNILSFSLLTGTGTDQNAFFGFTGQANALGISDSLTTTWQRFSHTVTLGTSITQLALDFAFSPTGTAGANDYFEITGVQLEIGSVATPFSRAGGTLQGELAACSRYFQVLNPNDPTRIIGQCISSTRAFVFYGFPVTMRGNATPTFGAASNYQISDATANGLICTGATFFTVGTKYVLLDFTVASGLVAGNATQAILTGASSTISLSAEL
jgi:hypothetical protein